MIRVIMVKVCPEYFENPNQDWNNNFSHNEKWLNMTVRHCAYAHYVIFLYHPDNNFLGRNFFYFQFLDSEVKGQKG